MLIHGDSQLLVTMVLVVLKCNADPSHTLGISMEFLTELAQSAGSKPHSETMNFMLRVTF